MNNDIKVSGILWWSKDADLDSYPEMHPATPEQLETIEVIRDEKGIIIGARTRIADIVSVDKK